MNRKNEYSKSWRGWARPTERAKGFLHFGLYSSVRGLHDLVPYGRGLWRDRDQNRTRKVKITVILRVEDIP